MKIVTASFFQEENHGPGRKIGISPGKPNDVECDTVFYPLSPGQLYWDYHKQKKAGNEDAGENFVNGYKEQLDNFVHSVKKEAQETGKTVFEVLPFQDGDTLLSWENKGHLTYRAHAAEALRELGYEVEEN